MIILTHETVPNMLAYARWVLQVVWKLTYIYTYKHIGIQVRIKR